MNLIDVNEQLPKRRGILVVKIGEEYFIASSDYAGGERTEYEVRFVMVRTNFNDDDSRVGKWVIPSHFKEPSYWAYLEAEETFLERKERMKKYESDKNVSS